MIEKNRHNLKRAIREMPEHDYPVPDEIWENIERALDKRALGSKTTKFLAKGFLALMALGLVFFVCIDKGKHKTDTHTNEISNAAADSQKTIANTDTTVQRIIIKEVYH